MYDGTGMLGTGSTNLCRRCSGCKYLDFKYWSENVSLGEWDTKKSLLADVESAFNEPSDNGFNKISDDFFGGLQELAKDPGNPSLRSLVKERGVSFAKYFNNLSFHLEKIQSDINYRVNVKVQAIVESLGTQVQELNQQIYTAELNGNIANDLRDQRTVLIDKLSKLVNIEVSEVTNGKLQRKR